jgi:hypothetical protein
MLRFRLTHTSIIAVPKYSDIHLDWNLYDIEANHVHTQPEKSSQGQIRQDSTSNVLASIRVLVVAQHLPLAKAYDKAKCDRISTQY